MLSILEGILKKLGLYDSLEITVGSGIDRFEDLVAWQKARLLTKEIYQVTRQGAFAKDYGLSGQIQRAAVSIMSNIAEGFERNRQGEFHQFLSIAKASCAELRSQLYVAFDANYLNQAEFTQLLTQAEEVARIIGGLRASVERRKISNSALKSQHSAL
ncbi:MAG: four helix bundle protein [Tildeniella nuda ZEHNDER 1965/U140]|nr:four helix bundle protein [Tildeniella nuda ZEHNDER 1965/U140]